MQYTRLDLVTAVRNGMSSCEVPSNHTLPNNTYHIYIYMSVEYFQNFRSYSESVMNNEFVEIPNI